MISKFKITAGIFLWCSVLTVSAAADVLSVSAEENSLELYARGAVLMDGDSGRILYGKEADTPMTMASTTKIMTCIVALEEAEPDLICTVSEHAASQPKVKLGMTAGDTFYLNELLYSLMLESHNDTAVCIAENVSGSVEAFIAKMNEKAAEIGCQDTYYITPNGLDGKDDGGTHHTTAKELALVMRYCLTQSDQSETFLEITRASSRTFTNIEGSRTYSCTNHNTLLTILDGAISGKTGFTNQAGYCYIGAVEQEDKFLIISLLGSGWPNNRGYKWIDTKKLVRYGVENYEKKELMDRTLQSPDAAVINGQTDYVKTEIQWENADCDSASILINNNEKIEIRTELPENLEAPVRAGQQIGTIQYTLNNEIYAVYPIAAVHTVPERNLPYCFTELLNCFLL